MEVAELLEKLELDDIELLLDQSKNIHHKISTNKTLLQTVLKTYLNIGESRSKYYIEILRSLIHRGANVNELDKADELGYTPLYYAVVDENIEAINFLREHGVDFGIIAEDGKNLLHLLVIGNRFLKEDDSGGMKAVDVLVSTGCQVNAKDASGHTPLHYAAIHDKVEIARKLLEHGAEVNCKTSDGMTPLHLVAPEGNTAFVKLLREFGADFNAATSNGETVMHLIVKRQHFMTSRAEEKYTFNLLMKSGCQINVKDNIGNSPLHVAAEHADIMIVRMLIEQGAHVNCRNNQMQTPLHFSTTNYKAHHVIELLFQHGANVNAKDLNGRTALHKLATEPILSHLLSSPCATLLSYGADINALDVNGMSVLCYARIRDSKDYEKKCEEYVKKHNESLLENYHSDKIGNHTADSPPQQMTVADCPIPKKISSVLGYLAGYFFQFKAAKLPRNEIIIDSWLENLSAQNVSWDCKKYYKECLEKVEELKSTLIDDRTSLYNFLHMNSNSRCAYLNNEKLNNFMNPPRFGFIKGVNYKLVMKAKYNEAVTRKSLLEPAKLVWMKFTGYALPDLCVDCIFSFLNNEDLFNIIELY